MKKLLFFALTLIAVSSCECSSSKDEPTVTFSSESGTSYPNFGAHYYTLHDGNRLCSRYGNEINNHFVITKTNKIINSADVCDRCGHAWYNHIKK